MSPAFDPRSVWARFILARRALEMVTHGLASHAIDVLAVKGVITSEWLYEDRSERPLSDVDLRIRPRDFEAAGRASRSQGWRIARRLRAYRSLVLDVPGAGIAVDVESYVGPPGLCAVSVDRMFERATRAPGGFWIPDIHDHALLLTVNVFKDKMTHAMPWAIEDVARVIGVDGFDADTFIERIREARVTTLAWLVADWMIRHRNGDPWRDVRSRLARDARRRPAYRFVLRHLQAHDTEFPLPLRVLSRLGSDDRSRWPSALALAAASDIEAWLETRRRR
jgi:Uncharacterised nucleotidyltransferase